MLFFKFHKGNHRPRWHHQTKPNSKNIVIPIWHKLFKRLEKKEPFPTYFMTPMALTPKPEDDITTKKITGQYHT